MRKKSSSAQQKKSICANINSTVSNTFSDILTDIQIIINFDIDINTMLENSICFGEIENIPITLQK